MDEMTAIRARALLEYNPETGKMLWKVRTSKCIRVGSVAGCVSKQLGYVLVRLDKRLYLAHRLAWLIHTGEWPLGEIDHMNGKRDDNRIANLRDVSKKENSRNVSDARSSSKSGILGVYRKRGASNWTARITVDGVATHIGVFPTAEAAGEAYRKAKAVLHPSWVRGRDVTRETGHLGSQCVQYA